MAAHELALVGGYWFFLTVFHVFVDFLGQDHDTAVSKAHDSQTRFFHCLLYSMLMLIPMISFGLTWGEMTVSFIALFASHYIGDSYVLVLLWFKHIRQPPWAKDRDLKGIADAFQHLPITVQTHIEIILFVLVDQMWHILWLLLPALFAVWEGWL